MLTTINNPIDPQQDELLKLILAVQQADEEAFSQLYELLVAKMYGLALRMMGDRADTEEVVADAFTQIWQRAKHYHPSKGRVIAWCMVITRSRALDYLRKRKTAQGGQIRQDSALEHLSSDDFSPEEIITMFEQSSQTQRLMAALPALPRQLLALSFFKGMSHQEISHSNKIPLGTVKSHIKRALDQLQKTGHDR